MNSYVRLASLRFLDIFKSRINYQNLRFGSAKSIANFYWSLQTNYSCNYDCSYCVQGFGLGEGRNALPNIRMADPDLFLKINRLEGILGSKVECLTIQGGEPLLYKHLPYLLKNLRAFKKVIIVSNLALDISPYIILGNGAGNIAELKFIGSYHSKFSSLDDFLNTASKLKDAGMLEYCDIVDEDWTTSINLMNAFKRRGIPLKLYSYVGEKDGAIYPIKATKACSGKRVQRVLCRSAYVLIAPDGKIYNCHAKMYRDAGAICSIEEFPEKFTTGYFPCDEYGLCQPCQISGIQIKKIG